jgi:chorismate dehydratase
MTSHTRSPSPIRVGAVNYLNTKPLIEQFETLAPNAKLSLELPSRLADQLHQGQIDVGLIPVIEYFRGQNYRFLPNIAIASRGPVLSVTLFSKLPWEQVRTIALDVGSRSSAALTRILSIKRFGVQPKFQPFSMQDDPDHAKTDAVLLIGDRAMHACLPQFEFAYDLGQEWFNWTGLPFVFALWAVRPEVELGVVHDAFYESKRLGRKHVGAIAQREAIEMNLDAGFCRRYLETVIQYDLGPRELAGMERYYREACALGLAPEGVSIEPYHSANLVQSH